MDARIPRNSAIIEPSYIGESWVSLCSLRQHLEDVASVTSSVMQPFRRFIVFPLKRGASTSPYSLGRRYLTAVVLSHRLNTVYVLIYRSYLFEGYFAGQVYLFTSTTDSDYVLLGRKPYSFLLSLYSGPFMDISRS